MAYINRLIVGQMHSTSGLLCNALGGIVILSIILSFMVTIGGHRMVLADLSFIYKNIHRKERYK